MHPALIAVIVIAVIVIVVIRRFRGEPVDAKDLAVSPVILLAISVKDLWDFDHWTAANVVFLTVSIVVGLGFGLYVVGLGIGFGRWCGAVRSVLDAVRPCRGARWPVVGHRCEGRDVTDMTVGMDDQPGTARVVLGYGAYRPPERTCDAT